MYGMFKSIPETFLQNVMPQSWLTKDFKKSRQTTLVERQKAMVPETMPYIEQRKILINTKQIKEHQATIIKKTQEIKQLQEEQNALYQMIERIPNGESVTSDKQKKRHTIKCPNCPAFLNQSYMSIM